MKRSHLLIAIIIVTITSCSKKQKELSVPLDAPSKTIQTTLTPVFKQTTDTFIGNCCSRPPYYYLADSPLAFYVFHLTPDSFRVTSNATYAHEDYQVAEPKKLLFKRNDKNAYSFYKGNIVFKQDSILFTFNYYHDWCKGPTGGGSTAKIKLYGRHINKKEIFPESKPRYK